MNRAPSNAFLIKDLKIQTHHQHTHTHTTTPPSSMQRWQPSSDGNGELITASMLNSHYLVMRCGAGPRARRPPPPHSPFSSGGFDGQKPWCHQQERATPTLSQRWISSFMLIVYTCDYEVKQCVCVCVCVLCVCVTHVCGNLNLFGGSLVCAGLSKWTLWTC